MNIEIKEVGDKLKELRKRLNLKQEELVKHGNKDAKDKTFTRNLVSMVETGKSPLTKNLADCIYYNLIQACEERGKEPDFDFVDICKTPEEQTREYVSNYVENLTDILSPKESVKYADKLIELSEKYKLYKELSILYMSLGTVLFKHHDWDEAIKYFNQAYVLKNEFSEEKMIWIATQIKYIYIIQKQYEKALRIKVDLNIDKKEYVIKCLYNDIMCYKGLNMLNECYKKVKELEALISKKDKVYFKIKIIEANIYYLQDKYKKCINVYQELLKRKLPPNEKILTKVNLLEVKIKLGMNYSDMIEELDEEVWSDQISKNIIMDLLIIVASGFDKMGDPRASRYYRIIIDKSIDKGDKNAFNDAVENMIKSVQEQPVCSERDFEEIMLLVTAGIKKKLFNEMTFLNILYFFQKKKKYDIVSNFLEKSVG